MVRSYSVSAHDTHAQLTREKILDAAKRVVARQGIKQLTVRNICAEAGLSTGSFYNLFSNKDDLISYYLTQEFEAFKERALTEAENKNVIEKCLLVYRFYVSCCMNIGLEFVSSFYSSNANPAFDFIHRDSENSIIIDLIGSYLEEGKAQGLIKDDVDIQTEKLVIASIVTGMFFYWCVFKGEFDIKYECDRALQQHLLSLVEDSSVCVNLDPIQPVKRFSELY